ncbi:Arc family DNA-binding protein [Castellaniella ginsengisoli]|uniref:Arc family DNA-binding protein n=1 Tax=Castellaniella ginsengisoli TaxID=546114 RepID=A0AB39D6I2_9BURK
MARNDPQVNFRMPQELRDKLESAAKANSRTLTAEIVARLQDSFEQQETRAHSLAPTRDITDGPIGLGRRQLINRALAIDARIASLQSLLQGKRTERQIFLLSNPGADTEWFDAGISDTEKRISSSQAELERVRATLSNTFAINTNPGLDDQEKKRRRDSLLAELEKMEDEWMDSLFDKASQKLRADIKKRTTSRKK